MNQFVLNELRSNGINIEKKSPKNMKIKMINLEYYRHELQNPKKTFRTYHNMKR